MKPYLLLGLIAVGAAGCGYLKKDATEEQLASGCQIVKCICIPVRDSILPSFSKREPVDPLWRPDGKAYCPEGQRLERKDAPSMYDRPIY